MTTIMIDGLTLDEEVGARIQALMFRRRVSQGQLAQALGIGQSTVSGKLRGRTVISIRDLYTIAGVLEVDPGDLLPRLDSNQQPSGYWSSLVSEVEPWFPEAA